MHKEIERRWYVKQIPSHVREEMSADSCWEVIQGYLGNGVRVRVETKLVSGEMHSYLVEKHGRGLSRDESSDLEIPLEAGRLLLKATKEIVSKQRTLAGSLEIDEFLDELESLIFVEREFATVEEALAYTPPSWLTREITETVSNRKLAKWLAQGKSLQEILKECT